MRLFLLLSFLLSVPAHAKLNILATTPDLGALATEVGGEFVSVDFVSKGTQDPHYIEAKPSFMVKASRADLVLAVGLELEIGWLPSILQGARNPKVMPGNPGYLELGSTIQPLEVPQGKVTRAEGDVHPLGNPHFWLDPIRTGEAGVVLAKRLGELDAEHAARFMELAKKLQTRLAGKTQAWDARVKATGVKKIVTYHKTLTYFFDRFHLENPAILEPKPGIPPTSGHTLDIIRMMKEQKILLVLIENLFDSKLSERIEQEVPGAKVRTVPVAVGGEPGVKTLDDLYEALVKAVEGKV